MAAVICCIAKLLGKKHFFLTSISSTSTNAMTPIHQCSLVSRCGRWWDGAAPWRPSTLLSPLPPCHPSGHFFGMLPIHEFNLTPAEGLAILFFSSDTSTGALYWPCSTRNQQIVCFFTHPNATKSQEDYFYTTVTTKISSCNL